MRADLWRDVLRASARDLSRRRTALILLVALPFVMYGATDSGVFLVLVGGWSIATLSLFSWVFAHGLERRLAVIGAAPGQLFAGRMLALGSLGVLVAAVGGALLGYGHHEAARPWALVAAVFTSCLLGVPLGALVGQLLPREMEGALALMVVMAMQFAVAGAPAGAWTRLLPLDGPSRLVEYGYNPRLGPVDALAASGQCVGAALVLVVGAWFLADRRLRTVRVAPLGGVA